MVVDAERYRERRREALTALAHRTADRVRRSGEPVPLEPMSAAERRVIHTVLAADEGVATHSEGDGADRHVVIALRGEETAARPESGMPEENLEGRDELEPPQDRQD